MPIEPVWVEHDKGCILLKVQPTRETSAQICDKMAEDKINIEYLALSTMPKMKEAHVALIVHAKHLTKAVNKLLSVKKEIRIRELYHGVLSCISLDLSRVRHIPGIGSRLFKVFVRRGINVYITITTVVGIKFYIEPERVTENLLGELARMVS